LVSPNYSVLWARAFWRTSIVMTSMKSTEVGETGEGRIYLVNGVELTREYLDSKWIQETNGANELRSENEIKEKTNHFSVK